MYEYMDTKHTNVHLYCTVLYVYVRVHKVNCMVYIHTLHRCLVNWMHLHVHVHTYIQHIPVHVYTNVHAANINSHACHSRASQ